MVGVEGGRVDLFGVVWGSSRNKCKKQQMQKSRRNESTPTCAQSLCIAAAATKQLALTYIKLASTLLLKTKPWATSKKT